MKKALIALCVIVAVAAAMLASAPAKPVKSDFWPTTTDYPCMFVEDCATQPVDQGYPYPAPVYNPYPAPYPAPVQDPYPAPPTGVTPTIEPRTFGPAATLTPTATASSVQSRHVNQEPTTTIVPMVGWLRRALWALSGLLR